MTEPRLRRGRMSSAAAFLLLATLLLAAPSFAGTTFDLLRQDVTARGAALGSHSIALSAGDLSALSGHPAGLAGLDRPMADAAYSDHPLDIAGGRLGYGRPMLNGVAAVSLTYLNYGDFDRRADLLEPSGGTFTPTDLVATVAYATELIPDLAVGAAAKFVQSEIDNYSSSAVAADLSVHWNPNWQKVQFAAGASNLGVQLSQYGDTREDLPVAVHAGLAKELAHLPLTLGLTGHVEPGDGVWGTLAGEFVVSPLLRLRAGYTSRATDYQVEGEEDTFAGLSAGLGLRYLDLALDYAFHSQGALGQVHRFGFGYRF